MRFNWRALPGPALAAATASLAAVFDRGLDVVPELAPMFVCIATLSAALGGISAGLVSAGVAVACMALMTLHQDVPAGLDRADLTPAVMLAIAAGGAAIITGGLRRSTRGALIRQRERHAAAERLAAALDRIEIGVVLLDSDTRAQFINCAFRDYFSLPDFTADSKPPFIALLYHGRDIGAYEMPAHELGAFVAERMRLMRAGDATPINIDLSDGEVLRFSCTALPDGGRMLTYTPVTELVRYTDPESDKDYCLSLRNGSRELREQIRAAE